MEINNKLYLPPELIEKIVCYFDGRTLLTFKSLSKTCNAIASNVQRYNNTLWKQICLNEIPKQYLIDLITKNFGSSISLDSFSETQYEMIYEHWIKWQSTGFNITQIARKHFLDHDRIKKIICHKFDVLVVFTEYKCVFSLINNEENTKSYSIKENKREVCEPNTLVVLNPQQHTNIKNEEHNLYKNYIICREYSTNMCPLHHIFTDRGHREHNRLLDLDTNIYANVCCWVREESCELHSFDHSSQYLRISTFEYYCKNVICTMYVSVVHGIIINRIRNNCINIYAIYEDLHLTVQSWLNRKYFEATALYIFMNILFVGTRNGYLLAYRLQCLDDLINLKEKNILLEIQLGLGKIIRLDVMDFKSIYAIVVASMSSVVWIKVN